MQQQQVPPQQQQYAPPPQQQQQQYAPPQQQQQQYAPPQQQYGSPAVGEQPATWRHMQMHDAEGRLSQPGGVGMGMGGVGGAGSYGSAQPANHGLTGFSRRNVSSGY